MGISTEVRKGSMYIEGVGMSAGRGSPSKSIPGGGVSMACTWRGKPHGEADRPSWRTM